MEERSRHTWVPYVAAAAGTVLALKAVLVMATDDGAPTAMGVLYLVGLLLGLLAATGAALRQRGLARRVGVGLGCAALLILWILGLGDVLKPVVGLVTDYQHAKDEVPILLAGLVLIGLAWPARARDLGAAVGVRDTGTTAGRSTTVRAQP